MLGSGGATSGRAAIERRASAAVRDALGVAQYVVAATRYHLGPAPAAVLEELDYDGYWRARGARAPMPPPPDDVWDLPRYQAMAARIAPGESVLDVGCGSGSFLAYLRGLGHTRLRGVDTSHLAVQSLRAHGFDAAQASLETLDGEVIGSPDVVVLSEVLEHVVGFEDALRRVIACAGRVLVSHPNIAYWPHRLRLLTGRFPVQWAWHPAEHVRFFSVADLLQLFDREGYVVHSVQAPIGFPVRSLRERFPNLLAGSVVVELSAGQPRTPGSR